MDKCNVSLQIIPLVPSEKIYQTVDKVIEMIDATGVKYLVGPMETTMEGELDELLEIVKKAQQICLDEGAERVLSMIKIDYAPGGVTIDEKIGKYNK
ncbi:MAG: MTH1187 family thiamine-binding protein [Bacillota bacterium]|nr:MTH1187 family thiamine-binding protein [Bacillota bacterium]